MGNEYKFRLFSSHHYVCHIIEKAHFDNSYYFPTSASLSSCKCLRVLRSKSMETIIFTLKLFISIFTQFYIFSCVQMTIGRQYKCLYG